ncbi:uncharacterized protein LOC133328521 [Musca vetustissima]|uniref:uncharacterized protein LOC133328521 n=1 Tax=Musca vetustissima TaxID=27455 RepID=UPI002AB748D7|nr:uncharacterized protein LOC133328521 [Musca vetustissima]
MREFSGLFLIAFIEICWVASEEAFQHTDMPPQMPVAASEATLLTPPTPGHMALNFETHQNYPEEENSPPKKFENPRLSKNRYKITKVTTNCSRSFFEMQIEMNTPFHGLLYAKDFPQECRARGTSERNITLRLPTSGCGVRVEPRSDGSMELSVRVMMQMEEKLRQSSDILRTIKCKLPQNAMGMNLAMDGEGVGEEGKTFRSSNSHHHQVSSAASSSSTPRIRIWLELGGPDGSGSVVVGQATTLTVRAVVPGTMGLKIVDCAALDGLGESTQQLLDDRGCPIDEQVMPALHTTIKPAEEGWSKLDEEDLVEKTYTATFPAFKFPDRERLHVSCGVQLCKGRCPNVNCRTSEKLILSSDKHLARIEVFNSLAVTAPQIEVDRLRYDRRHNMSAEEYEPYVRPLINDGTLCLSVSKLAMSFCILGLIFLVAIVVAITSLIRSRRRMAAIHNCGSLSNNSSRLHRAEVCTSMFSSSSESAQSARFGTKFFMPYYPNTLPYGRVY